MSDINQQISFLLWFDFEQWGWAKMNWIQYFQIANIKDSTTTIHIEKKSKSIFLQQKCRQIPKMRILGAHIIKGLDHWWGQILSESLAANTNMLSLSQEETPAARATHYLSRVWEGCDRCDGEDGFAPHTNRYCSPGTKASAHPPPSPSWSWSFSSWPHISSIKSGPVSSIYLQEFQLYTMNFTDPLGRIQL